jgi:hypothetical protein
LVFFEREWHHNQQKLNQVCRMARAALDLDQIRVGSELAIYKIHPQGGPNGRPGAISGGDEVGHEAVHAYFTYTRKGWKSQQRGAATAGQAYLGFDYGGGQGQAVAGIFIEWSGPQYTPPALKAQWSDDGRHWSDVGPLKPRGVLVADYWTDEFQLPDAGAHRYWRVLADAATPEGNPMAIKQLRFVEKQ